MKLLDANILLYAYDSGSPHHSLCRAWLEAALNGDETIALPWQTILAFVRIASNPKATRRPLSGSAACAIVASWLSRPCVAVVGPGERFWEIFREQITEAQVSGPLVTDAALAALALENGAVLCSTDRDFRRFKGLQISDPLQSA
ncbi:MAG TPA: TA system VapC family ribonuclease toxin [Steroidobacteraceae bacterium]